MHPDTLFHVLWWSMALISVLSIIYPWNLDTLFSKIFMHLPISLFFLLPRYERLIEPEANIRIDLLPLYPLFFIASICYILKWLILLNVLTPNNKSTT